MSEQIHRIADKPPVFPCWLWFEPQDCTSYGFRTWNYWKGIGHLPHGWSIIKQGYTHWSPNSPAAPEVRPDEAIPQEFVDALRDVENNDFVSLDEATSGKPPASTPSPAAVAAARDCAIQLATWIVTSDLPLEFKCGSPDGLIHALTPPLAAIIDKHLAARGEDSK